MPPGRSTLSSQRDFADIHRREIVLISRWGNDFVFNVNRYSIQNAPAPGRQNAALSLPTGTVRVPEVNCGFHHYAAALAADSVAREWELARQPRGNGLDQRENPALLFLLSRNYDSTKGAHVGPHLFYDRLALGGSGDTGDTLHGHE
jgi:hypothetical protein